MKIAALFINFHNSVYALDLLFKIHTVKEHIDYTDYALDPLYTNINTNIQIML